LFIALECRVMTLLTLLALSSSNAFAQQAASASDQEIAGRIDEYMSANVSIGLSGTLLVARGENVLLSKGYGFADKQKNIPNTPETVFDIGSNSKQFTAAAILKLVDQSKLKLTDTLGSLFDDAAADKKAITIHQLLTHTSGLQEYSGRDSESLSLDSFLERVFKSELLYAPGEKFEYSNVGYSLLAAIIERTSGTDYEAFLAEQLFEPAGMKHTGYLLPDWSGQQLALGYHRGFNEMGTTIARYKQVGVSWNLMGNGGINSTAEDLYRWFRAVQGGKILSPSSRDLFYAPHAVRNSESRWRYGYGWLVSESNRNTRVLAHNGANGVYWSSLYWYPDENVTLIYSSNYDSANLNGIAIEVRQLFFDADYQPKTLTPAPYLLVYRFTQEREAKDVARLVEMLALGTGSPLADRNILNRVGYWHLEQKNYDWAFALYELNIELFPGDGNLWDSLGEAYLVTNQNGQALEAFKKALALAPEEECFWCDNAREKILQLEQEGGRIG